MKNVLPIVALLFLMSSCGPTLRPFTKTLQEDNEWSSEELKQIQFYLSENIVLNREASGGTSEIVGGEIKVIEGKEVEQVVIKKGTPGIFLFSPKDDRFAVGFDSNSDDLYLIFGPNPKAANRYVLLGSSWKRKRGKVTYGGKKWDVNASSAWATLMVDLKKIKKTSVNKSTAKGRKVGG